MKIWCPGCEWHPKPNSRWWCTRSCGHVWNTFDTGGVCPACNKIWEMTACLSCHNYFPHIDWYHDDQTNDVEIIEEVATPETITVPAGTGRWRSGVGSP